MGRSRKPRTRAVAAALVGLSVLAAACGSDDGGGETAATVDSEVTKGVSEALGGSSTSGATAAAEPTSMEEWESDD